jgi:transposase, IS5 family
MLIDRYAEEDVFARVPQVAAQTDPVLKRLDVLLDDDLLFTQVKADLARRHPRTLGCGRHSTPVEVILRLLVCKHLYQWSFQETEDRVNDSLILRWFCRVYFEQVPDDTTLIRWAQLIRPQTLHALNDRVVELATQAKVIRGRKLRLDGTCVQTTIHHPTDSGLLVDSVRVLSRFVERAKPLVEGKMASAKEVCRSRVRSVRQVAQKLHRLVRRAEAGEKQQEQQAEQQRILYQQLISSTEQMVRQARQVSTSLLQQAEKSAQSLVEKVEPLLPLVERVIVQARARVLEGKQVAASDKVLSLFEPQTRIIPRHQGGAAVEFGRQVELDEVEGGIITRYQILSHPDEHGQGLQALSHHQQLFGHPPRLLAGDRGVHSAETELKALTAGVQVVAIPAVGKISVVRQAVEHSRRWKRGYRWRAGIEGRIASLRRDYGLRKSAYHGQDGMERWIGLGVIASNLRHIAQAQGIKKAKKRAV